MKRSKGEKVESNHTGSVESNHTCPRPVGTHQGQLKRSETGENPTATSLIKGEKHTPEYPLHETRLQANSNDIRPRWARDGKEIDRRLESD